MAIRPLELIFYSFSVCFFFDWMNFTAYAQIWMWICDIIWAISDGVRWRFAWADNATPPSLWYISHSFVGVFNRFANMCRQGSTGVWKGVWRLEVPVQRNRSICVSTWSLPVQNLILLKFWTKKFLQFVLMYGEASCKISQICTDPKFSAIW